MRISDWSSDVCSSDLAQHLSADGSARRIRARGGLRAADAQATGCALGLQWPGHASRLADLAAPAAERHHGAAGGRMRRERRDRRFDDPKTPEEAQALAREHQAVDALVSAMAGRRLAPPTDSGLGLQIGRGNV